MAATAIDTRMHKRLAGKIARVDAALATPWWRARLGRRLDAHFETASSAASIDTFKFWLILLVFAQLLGLLRDATFGAQQMGLLLRGGVVTPLLIGTVIALGRRPSRKVVVGLTSAAVLTVLFVQMLLAIEVGQPRTDRYLMGALFAFSVLHILMPFTHRQIVAHGVLVGTSLSLTAWVFKSDALIVDCLELLLPAVTLIATIGALMTRHGRRRAFLIDLRSALQADALEQANRKLAHLLREDTLTGIFNRRYFDETMQRLWNDAQASGRSLGLILLDVDRFKSFNDRQGHRAGDTCLKEVASRLSASLRESDFVVARYGGEEFAVILPGVNAVGAHAIGERLREAVENLAWPHPAGGCVTVSVGTTASVPDAMRAHYALVDAADRALYASKEAGRNCVTASFIASEPERPAVRAA